MWTKAFWKDTVERMVGTVLAALAVVIPVDLTGLKELDFNEIVVGLALLAAATLVKCLIAVTANPNTGGSFGTTIPGDLVQAYTNQKTSIDASYAGGKVTSHPGDTIAGPAAASKVAQGVSEGDPVYVAPVPTDEATLPQ